MKPAISVIVPVYNEENYLEECLKSLVYQTLSEIEIIVIDDASTDSSRDIIKKYMILDSRIKPILLKENVGISGARNAGLDIAKGEYIAFVDSDDFVEKNIFEKAYEASLEWKSDIVSYGYKKYYKNEVTSEQTFPITSTSNISHEAMLSLLEIGHDLGFIWFVWRNIYKREMLIENKIKFNEKIRFGEDSIFNFYSFYHSKSTKVISDFMYFYRDTPNSLTSKKGKPYLEENLIQQYQEKLKFYAKYKFRDRAYEDLYRYIVVHQLPMMLSNAIALKPKNIKKELNRILMLPMIQNSIKRVSFYDKGLSRGIRIMLILIKFRQIRLLYLLLLK